VSSWLAFTNRSNDDVYGDLSWIKLSNPASRRYPNGLTNDCTAVGSAYVAPVGTNILNLVSARLEFSGGNLGTGFTNYVNVGLKNKFSNTRSNALCMSFSPSSGVFAGRVTDPVSGHSSSFSGVVLPKMNLGCGFLLGTNQSSQVLLAP